uniref:DUF4870 family protein n=1 Tax=Thaumasiovibrio occultus TaxID=1891184 RepID=UPI000B34E561|nr:hypothetical protein [Thaumasiovibrio occultus]
MSDSEIVVVKKDIELKNHTLIAYGLLLAGFVSGGLLSIAGVIFAYIKRSDAQGTVFESHFSNAISTFWISVILGIIALVTLVIGIGFLIGLAATIYCLYRYIKGLTQALDNKPYS